MLIPQPHNHTTPVHGAGVEALAQLLAATLPACAARAAPPSLPVLPANAASQPPARGGPHYSRANTFKQTESPSKKRIKSTRSKPRRWTGAQKAAQSARIRALKPWVHSTGPRTASGKAKVSQNAVRHGHRGRWWLWLKSVLWAQHLYVLEIRARHHMWGLLAKEAIMNSASREPQIKDPDYRALEEKADADKAPPIHEDFEQAEVGEVDILAGIILPKYVIATKIGGQVSFTFAPPIDLLPDGWPPSIPLGNATTPAQIPTRTTPRYMALVNGLNTGVLPAHPDDPHLVPQ